MLPPGLSRAIAEATSPFGAYPAADVLRRLEVYLADSRSTDAVYEGLVSRACAQPLSTPLVEKVLALLKTYLLRFTPSQDVLQLLEEFSARAQDVAGLSVPGQKAVQYVRSCLRKIRPDKPGSLRGSRSSQNSLSGNSNSAASISLRNLLGRSKDDLTRLGPDARLSAVKVSVSSGALGQSNDRYATSDALPSPTDQDAASGLAAAALPAYLRLSDGKSGRGWEDLRLPPPQQGGTSPEPVWAVPGRPAVLPPAPPAVTALRARSWMQHLPDLAPRVTLAGPSLSLSLSGAAPINLATIHRCVLDLEDQDIGRHIAEVLGEARTEAEQLQPTTSQQRQNTGRGAGRGGGAGGAGGAARDGGKGRRGRPARLLFHHPPYNRAEQLPMTEADVAVVVEAVCGVRAANALSALQGPPAAADDVAAAAAAPGGIPEGMWQAAFEEDGDFAQMCGSILMKLIVDMWRREPVGSYVLVLRMLRNALRSDQAITRARAFDVLYNLAIHGAMLRGEGEEAALAAAANEMGNGVAGARGVQMPWQVCASAPVSPFMSGGGGQTPQPAPRPASAVTSTPAAAAVVATSTTAAPGGGGSGVAGPPGPHHVSSHSLGLVGSAMLDSGGSLAAAALGQHSRSTSKGPGGGSGPDGVPPAVRKDAADVARQPAPPLATPSASPAVKAAALVGGAGAGAEGSAPPGFDRWLRALLFQLLSDAIELHEYSEEVWRAAMGCVAQMCSHGGHWVASWVQHLPPPALSGLLRAALLLNWSHELYAHLLQLVPYVLVRTVSATAAGAATSPPHLQPGGTPVAAASKRPESAFAAATAVGSAAAAAADDPAAATATAAAVDAAEMSARLAAFGGLEELIYHFKRAPTPDSRAALLTALAFACSGGAAGSDVPGSGSLSSSGEKLSGGRSPRTSTSPSARSPEAGGPAAMLAALSGLHLDSVCLVLRAALQRPWQGMSGRLADVLASACGVTDPPGAGATGAAPSPSASLAGSADYGHHSLPAGVASPIAVRALLRPLLEALEALCAESMAVPQEADVRGHIDISVAHILGGAAGTGSAPAPPLTTDLVAAAWAAFKHTCSDPNPDARDLSTHWLHQLLSAACRTCQGQIPLLSPLSLKASQDATKPSAAAAAAAASALPGAAGPHPSTPLPQWNAALANALLHVVREVPLGCELLMAAISRVAADQKGLLAATDSPLSPRLAALAGPHTPGGVGVGSAGVGVGMGVAGEEPALAACRRVMSLYYVGLQWMLQCGSSDSRMPAVVELADTVLAALLQPDPAVAAATAAAAAGGGGDPDRAAVALGGASARGSNASLLGGGGVGASGAASRGANLLPQHPLQSQSQQQLQLSGATAAATAGGPTGVPEPGGGMLISQQLLGGLLALDPDALACTPPELLVTLLQQCSMSLQDAGAGAGVSAGSGGSGGPGSFRSNGLAAGGEAADRGDDGSEASGGGGFRSMHRGFLGRPCEVAAGGSAAAGPGPGSVRAGTPSVRSSGASGLGGGGAELALSGAAVGPWQDDWQDRRLALLLLLMARCSLDPEAFAKYSLSHVIKAQLGCEDLRCRYYAGVYLLKHWMLNQHDKYWRTLRHIIGTAQQLNDERLLDNPYLQMRTMLNVDHA